MVWLICSLEWCVLRYPSVLAPTELAGASSVFVCVYVSFTLDTGLHLRYQVDAPAGVTRKEDQTRAVFLRYLPLVFHRVSTAVKQQETP